MDRKSGANETCFSKRPREITRTTKKSGKSVPFGKISIYRCELHSQHFAFEANEQRTSKGDRESSELKYKVEIPKSTTEGERAEETCHEEENKKHH